MGLINIHKNYKNTNILKNLKPGDTFFFKRNDSNKITTSIVKRIDVDSEFISIDDIKGDEFIYDDSIYIKLEGGLNNTYIIYKDLFNKTNYIICTEKKDLKYFNKSYSN